MDLERTNRRMARASSRKLARIQELKDLAGTLRKGKSGITFEIRKHAVLEWLLPRQNLIARTTRRASSRTFPLAWVDDESDEDFSKRIVEAMEQIASSG